MAARGRPTGWDLLRRERLASQKHKDMMQKRKEQPEKLAEAGRQRRAALRAAGLCIRCGKEEAAASHALCPDCLEKLKAYKKARK